MSPFEILFSNLFLNIKNFFWLHDRYLTLGLILALMPLPFSGFIALVIGLFGLIFQIQKKFIQNEFLYIALILTLSLLNIFFTSIFFVFIYTEFFNYLGSIRDFILNYLNSLLGRSNQFIWDLIDSKWIYPYINVITLYVSWPHEKSINS